MYCITNKIKVQCSQLFSMFSIEMKKVFIQFLQIKQYIRKEIGKKNWDVSIGLYIFSGGCYNLKKLSYVMMRRFTDGERIRRQSGYGHWKV